METQDISKTAPYIQPHNKRTSWYRKIMKLINDSVSSLSYKFEDVL